MLNGRCLCGSVAFTTTAEVTDIYQCHCSKCRKATGAGNIAVFLASGESFTWQQGKDHIQLFVTPTGYRSVFCKTCGSRLPDPNPEETTFWVPAGLLDNQDTGLKVGAHVYCDSKADWDIIGDEGVCYEEGFVT